MVTNETALVETDLFGDIVSTDVVKPQKAPRPVLQLTPVSKSASDVCRKAANIGAMTDMFSHLKAIEVKGNRSFAARLRDSVSRIPSAPELKEFDDDQKVENMFQSIGTDEELAVEQKHYQPTEEFIRRVHQQALYENLVFLLSTDRKLRVDLEKIDVLKWIFTVDVIDGRNVRTIPFSYVNCCIADGVDPDDLILALLQVKLVRDLLIGLNLYRERDLPPLRKKAMYQGTYTGEDEDSYSDTEAEDKTEGKEPGSTPAKRDKQFKTYQFAGS